MDSLARLSAAAMARNIREKKLSPVELVEAHLNRIERLNRKLTAFVSLDPERALAEARAAEAAVMRGERVGALHGVPLSIKSSIDVAGLRCEAGSALRAGHVPARDAPLVARLRAAGGIILGTTNVPEMLMGYETQSPLYGTTNNPWDLGRTPGGSSGGEAAAIAAGLSAAGVGSDGGGSVRVPAHFSGICALKPTPGRIPASGHFPPSGGPFALLGVVGPMARTVADLRLLLEVMAGPDCGDPTSVPVQVRQVSREELGRYRIGVFEDDARTPVTAETRAAIQAAAASLKRAGFEVVPYRPEGLEKARQLWTLFFCWGALTTLRPLMGGREAELPILKEYTETVSARTPLTAEGLLNAWIEADQLRVRMREQMEEFSLLLCPVCSIPAFRHGERAWGVEGRTVRYLEAMSYTQWFNVLGNPVVVVPVGRSAEGLPIGVQLVGRPYEEEVVLAVAEKLEQERGDWPAPPTWGLSV